MRCGSLENPAKATPSGQGTQDYPYLINSIKLEVKKILCLNDNLPELCSRGVDLVIDDGEGLLAFARFTPRGPRREIQSEINPLGLGQISPHDVMEEALEGNLLLFAFPANCGASFQSACRLCRVPILFLMRL